MEEQIAREEMLNRENEASRADVINLLKNNAYLEGVINGISFALGKNFRDFLNDNNNEQR